VVLPFLEGAVSPIWGVFLSSASTAWISEAACDPFADHGTVFRVNNGPAKKNWLFRASSFVIILE